MVFIHGGSWRTGDRSMYPLLGNRFAKPGIGVAIPSYRLMPNNPHPAQIEDAAAAFAWVYRNIAQYGGDTKRIYLAGHSAGGHLAALLALDGEYLKKHDVPARAIQGVASMSGVYDVGTLGCVSGRRRRSFSDSPCPSEGSAVSDHLLPVGLFRAAQTGARIRRGLKKKFVGRSSSMFPAKTTFRNHQHLERRRSHRAGDSQFHQMTQRNSI